MKSVSYLTKVQEKYALENDAELAEKLGITRSTISLYKSDQRIMDEDTCLKIAIVLQMDSPVAVLMAASMDRARKTGKKSLWLHFAKKSR